MVKRLIEQLAIGLLFLLGSWSVSVAQERPGYVQYYLDLAQKHHGQMLDAAATLKAVDQTAWSETMLANYQVQACWYVYSGLTAYVLEREEVPSDLQSLVAAGYLQEWPANPLNAWRPARVLAATDPFSAGDFVLQTCPSSRFSLAGSVDSFRLTAQSYELSIYGPRPDHHQDLPSRPSDSNTWASTPAGSLCMIGFYSEPADVTLAKIQARIEKLRAEANAE